MGNLTKVWTDENGKAVPVQSFARCRMKRIHYNRERLERTHKDRVFTHGTKHRVHYEEMYGLVPMVRLMLKLTFLERVGRRNAESVFLNEFEVGLSNLPEGFDGCRILLITDLHFGGMEDFAEKLVGVVAGAEYDYCILGGDYSFRHYSQGWQEELDELVRFLKERSGVFAILGNHDVYDTAERLDGLGVEVLLNGHVCLERGGDRAYVVGVDDCHYYNAAEFEEAQVGIAEGAFKMLLCHSPEMYVEAERAGYSLYLAGHTHAGQLCLPGGVAVVSRTPGPRMLIKGLWRHGGMVGYTSSGAGSAGVAARFFCPPEIALMTLRRQSRT